MVLRRSVKEQARTTYREAILDAAERVFAQRGYHEAKIADIAAETGVSVGTLYNHFDSKEAVFLAIAERSHDHFLIATRGAFETKDPVERLWALVRAAFQFADERGALFSVYRQIGLLSEADFSRLGAEIQARHARFLEQLSGWFQEAADAGVVRADVSSRHLASAFAGTMNAFISDWLENGRKERLTDSSDLLVDLFLQGAGPR